MKSKASFLCLFGCIVCFIINLCVTVGVVGSSPVIPVELVLTRPLVTCNSDSTQQACAYSGGYGPCISVWNLHEGDAEMTAYQDAGPYVGISRKDRSIGFLFREGEPGIGTFKGTKVDRFVSLDALLMLAATREPPTGCANPACCCTPPCKCAPCTCGHLIPAPMPKIQGERP